jgi:hypothetical protein
MEQAELVSCFFHIGKKTVNDVNIFEVNSVIRQRIISPYKGANVFSKVCPLHWKHVGENEKIIMF